jgi:hypothetical protein
MRRIRCLPFLFLLALIAGTTSFAQSGRSTKSIEATLVRFSTALANGDTGALRQLTTKDFTLLDEGRVFDCDATISSIRVALASGTMTRLPTGFHTTVRGNIAWSHYEVGGEFRSQTGTVRLKLLEAAVLERFNGRWQIAMVTTIPQAEQ